MKPITCKWVGQQLHEYLAGWGTAEEREAVDLHLADCTSCAESAKIWSLLKTTAAQNRPRPLEPMVERRVLSGADPGLLNRRRQARRRLQIRRSLTAAAAVALLASAGTIALNRLDLSGVPRAAERVDARSVRAPASELDPGLDELDALTPVPEKDPLAHPARALMRQIPVTAGTSLWVMPDAVVEIAVLNETEARFHLERGEVIAEIGPVEPGFRFVVETADKAVEARGTVFAVQIGRSGHTLVRVVEGEVAVMDKASGQGGRIVTAGSQYDGRTVGEIEPLDGFADTRFAAVTQSPVTRLDAPGGSLPNRTFGRRPGALRGRSEPAELQGLGTQPTGPAQLLELARQHRQNRQYRSAAATYERLIGDYPRSEHAAIAMVALGQLRFSSLGQPERAIESFDLYLSSNPAQGSLYAAALAGKVRAFARLGYHHRVVEEAGRYLRMRDTGAAAAEMYRRRGEALANLDDCDRAVRDFERVMARWPSSPEATRAGNGIVQCRTHQDSTR